MKFFEKITKKLLSRPVPLIAARLPRPFEEGCKNCVSQNPGQSEAFWIYHPYLGNDNIELICCSAWPYWDKPKAAVLRFKFSRPAGIRGVLRPFYGQKRKRKLLPPLHSTWL